MDYLIILFVCVCFVCVPWTVPGYLPLYVALFLLWTIWLLTQHVTKGVLNYYCLFVFCLFVMFVVVLPSSTY
jgi:hypothetical protein